MENTLYRYPGMECSGRFTRNHLVSPFPQGQVATCPYQKLKLPSCMRRWAALRPQWAEDK